jgi:putative membrane protein
MKGFLLRWFINSLSLLIVTHIIKGIEIANTATVFVAALALGIINAFLRPLIIIVTLPINILTWGLFTFIINGFMFYLVAKIVKGFSIANFWTAFFGALLYSIISLLLNILINQEGRIEIRYIKEK